MPQQLIQSSFIFGEISDLLHAQVTSPIYYKAARRLRNVLVLPQGGCEKRFGLLYGGTIVGITDYTKIKPFIMDYQDGERYFMVFKEFAIDIYHNNVIVASAANTYTADEIKDLSITQTSNLVFIAHGNHKPAILRRITPHTGWVIDTNPAFVYYPTFDFDQNYDAITFKVQIGGVDIVVAQNLLGQIVDLISSAPIFTVNHVGGLFFGDTGTVRLISFNSNSSMLGRVVNIFDNESGLFHGTNSIAGSDAVLTEVAFSDTRGWPRKVSFFQNRIFFANTKSLVGGIWGSDYNGFKFNSFTFNDSESLDTNSISTVIYSKGSVVIRHIVSFKSLIILTSNGLYSTPLIQEAPLTPTNIAYLNQQTADSSSEVEPVIFDNEVIFFDKGGRKVKSITLNTYATRYQTNNISVLASHLINQPCSAAVFENSSSRDGNWLFMINKGEELEGTLSIYQSVPEQEINAWTLSTTDGLFRHVVAYEETVYFIVERTIGGVPILFFEQLDFNLDTDSAKTFSIVGTPVNVLTGLNYLEGEEVRVIGDGAVMDSQTVTSGSITLEREVNTAEVGLNYTPLIRPMPLNIPTQFGNNIYLPKSIKRVFIDYYQSAAIRVNGELIPPFQFNADQYNIPLTLKTDFSEVSPLNGWDPRQEIDITQTDPLPFTIIGIGFEVTL